MSPVTAVPVHRHTGTTKHTKREFHVKQSFFSCPSCFSWFEALVVIARAGDAERRAETTELV